MWYFIVLVTGFVAGAVVMWIYRKKVDKQIERAKADIIGK